MTISAQIYRAILGTLEANFVVIFLAVFVILILATIAITAWATHLKDWRGKVDEDRKEYKESITGILAEIQKDIKNIFHRLPSSTVEPGSPLRLSTLGEKVAEEIGIEQWITRYTEKLNSHMEGKNAYEIQEESFLYAQNSLLKDAGSDAEDLRNKMEMVAFKHGLQLRDILEAVGVVLRDEILKSLDVTMPPDKP